MKINKNVYVQYKDSNDRQMDNLQGKDLLKKNLISQNINIFPSPTE